MQQKSYHSGHLDLPPEQIGRHSGKPALRRLSDHLAKSSGRRIGSQFARLDTFSPGSSRRKCDVAARRVRAHAERALLAAMMQTAGTNVGTSLNDFSAHREASSKRPAKKCANPIPACARNISGSRGLKRMAHVKCSIARSDSPRKTLSQPLRSQAVAELGLSINARSTYGIPLSRLPVRWASAWPLLASAFASSLSNSVTRRASWMPSASSRAGSVIQRLILRHA